MLVVRNEQGTGMSVTYSAAAEEGHALKVSGAKTVAPAAAGDIAVAVSLHKVAAAGVGTIRIKGDLVPMIAGAAIAAGAKLVPGAVAGQVATRAAEGVETIIGIAWTAAANAGDTVLVFVL